MLENTSGKLLTTMTSKCYFHMDNKQQIKEVDKESEHKFHPFIKSSIAVHFDKLGTPALSLAHSMTYLQY